jgi:hypothetical protein
MAEDIMLAWETSVEALEMRRKFDDDEEEFEDGFTFDDEDDEDDDELEDDELEDEELEDEELEDDLILGDEDEEER